MSYQKVQRELIEAIELLRDTYSRDENFAAANWMAHNIKETDSCDHLVNVLRWLFCDMGRSMVDGYPAILQHYPELAAIVGILAKEADEDTWDLDLIEYLDNLW